MLETSDGDPTPTTSSQQESSSGPELKWAPLVLTEEKIKDLWGKLQEFPIIFDDFSKGDFQAFLHKLCSPANIFIDIGPGLGLAAGFAVRPGVDAVLHLVMFDRRLRGREGLFNDIIGYYFNLLQLRRMTCMLAEDAKTGIKLVERLGFRLEGTMRKSMKRGGILLDTHIYGMLREEFRNAG